MQGNKIICLYTLGWKLLTVRFMYKCIQLWKCFWKSIKVKNKAYRYKSNRCTREIQSISLPEGWAAALRATCQSIWFARKKDVFNPSCCWLQCCWFHQICIMLSIQGPTLQNRSIKSRCSLSHLLWMELFVQNSLCGFNLSMFYFVRGNVGLHATFCSMKPETTIWLMGLLNSFSLSLCPSLPFMSLKEIPVIPHWSWLVVSQVLAGGDGNVKVAAATAGWKFEHPIFSFQSKCVRECSTLI